MFFNVVKNKKVNERKGLKRFRFIFVCTILSSILSFTQKKEVKAEELSIATETNIDINNELYTLHQEVLEETQNSIESIYNNMLSEETLLNMSYESQVEYHKQLYNNLMSIANNAMNKTVINTNELLDNDNITVEKVVEIPVEVKESVPVVETKIETQKDVSIKPVVDEIIATNIEKQNVYKNVLNPVNGTANGPSGKETYYNLKMNRVIETMRKLGFSEDEYPYYIREDGAKCLGPYVMVATNLSVHPRGTIIETTLGKAIVCDTGSFAKSNPNQVDIATNWSRKKSLK